MAQKIYFDESGYTGNNLLHPQQKYFAYASVATDDEEAKHFVEALIKKYNIQGGELKGSKLVKFSKGRKAISEVLNAFNGRIKVSISDKKFALAGKFHEYIFEPCYSDVNSLFYGIGFHRFIANVLYMEFTARGAGAEELFSEFENLMRDGQSPSLESIFSSSAVKENSDVIRMIREFAQIRHQDIRQELESLAEGDTGKWVLDLTNSALLTLLANWGLEHDVLTAICDESKPLQHNQDVFNCMVGRTDKVFSDFGGDQHPITFNLSGPIEFASSGSSHGIQLADAIAAAAVYVFSGAKDDTAKEWAEILVPQAHYGSAVPDTDELQLGLHRTQLNVLVLQLLHERATEGISLTQGMREAILDRSRALRFSPPRFM